LHRVIRVIIPETAKKPNKLGFLENRLSYLSLWSNRPTPSAKIPYHIPPMICKANPIWNNF
jgi:hypothetical protein